MIAILSIKPKYAEAILSGKKRYEFRKHPIKKPVEFVLLYATSPIRKFIGRFKPGKILADTPSKIWEFCQADAGISKQEFFEYFQNSKIAYAIPILNFEPFFPPLSPDADFKPPQSFKYLAHAHKNKF